MKRIFCVFAVTLVIAISATSNAQVYMGKEATRHIAGSEIVYYKNSMDNPEFIKLYTGNEVDLSKSEGWIRSTFHLDVASSWILLSTEKDDAGNVHYRYQQTWQQTPIRDAIFILHTREGRIYSFNGIIYSTIQTANSKTVNKSDAFANALTFVHAVSYKWEDASEENWLKKISKDDNATYYPQGEMILVKDKQKGIYKYAWKFDIYASKPLSRQDVYVDAQTGEVLLTLNRLYTTDVEGTAVTHYSGTKTITTDSLSPTSFRLRETGRGNGIQTYNMQQGTNYGSAVDFTDADNYWNNVNGNQDEVATDAHWGAEMTYDYYWIKHNRNSIDNNGFALISYVHYDANYDNAFWDGVEMTYGDGSGSPYGPFTALDICGHEITHGLETFTSNFDYVDESGALSEGFSDVFGTCIEFYGKPATANWNCGEDIGAVLRSLSDPNVTGNPDTYLGTYWDPGQEVHQNSTVFSHWFYLLSQGGSGTNDNGDAYSVTGLGMDKASDIAFRALTIYLTNTSGYADARFYSIIAASDLYGGCSPEVEATTDAWYAVGVGGIYVNTVVPDFTGDYTTACKAPLTVQFSNISVNANTYFWDFGDGSTSTLTNPSHTFGADGDYNVQLIGYGGACGTDSITKTSFISINPGNTAIVSMPTSGVGMTQNCCLGKLYDSGGTNDYSNNTSSTITISPLGSMNIVLNFVSFNMESGYDYLYIYDGPNTSSPLIGQYDGTSLPNGGTITSTGGSLTFRQTSDLGVTASGYEINWQCNYATTAPTPNFSANITETCTGLVQFTDLSTNGPTEWLWDFGDGTIDSVQNPLHAFTTNGTYTVILTAGNNFGSNSITKTNYVVVNMPASPSVTPTTSCDSNTAVLLATGSGTLAWYDAPVAGTLLGTGSPFTTPVLYSTTTFYVEDQIIPPSTYGGLTDNSGAGGYFTNTNQHGLYFNCTQACTLASVKVYAQGAGNRTIALLNSSGSTILSGTFAIPDGESRVILNWNIPVQNGMQLMGPGSPNLFRNGAQGGPNLGYPFDIGGKISIYQSTAGSPNSLAFYYYFYDWELKDATCISARVPVVATVIECTGVEEIPGITGLNISPNPTDGLLNIDFTANESSSMIVKVFDILGRNLINQSFSSSQGPNKITLNLSNYSKGVYLLNLSNNSYSKLVKIVVQ
jgi:Zn-dependent metalloprotease